MGTSRGYEPPKGKGSPWDTLKRQMGMLIEKPDKNTKVVYLTKYGTLPSEYSTMEAKAFDLIKKYFE